ncbi:MAG: cytochrome c oxidase assembly protein [Gammaproteobacteria bacterium]|nr:MAG: cytochrome c oxidase assembly protein [Gammaproteobacteria bacterium]
MKEQDKINKRLAGKLFVVVIAMFGFGYALVPLYNLLCDVTGLNGKTQRSEDITVADVDRERWVTVEFTGQANSALPWDFYPMQGSMRVHPGQVMVAKYYARNRDTRAFTGQAVPSVAPNRAAPHFKKIECFCFTQQTLAPGEAKEMPIRFVVDRKLGKEVDRITLSYTFFNIDHKISDMTKKETVVHNHVQETNLVSVEPGT